MRPRRTGLGVAVMGALALLGTACQPSKPQMELDLDINPAGTFEVLTERITLNITVACTRPTDVTLRASALARWALYPDTTISVPLPDESGQEDQLITCRGPGYATNHRTVWRNPGGILEVDLDPLTVTMTAATTGDSSPINHDVDTATQTVTLTRLLCWPLPTTCSKV